jgi:uncharacterized protein
MEIPVNLKELCSNFLSKKLTIRSSGISKISFIITGSARLDYYRKGGDSLQGRYHYYRLHPFSLTELNSNPDKKDVETLLKFGGFPEPLLKAEEKFWRRWQRERLQRVIYEDIRDLENIKEISMLELLAHELPNRVGSPLSVKNIKEMLQVAHETVERWLQIFERMYYSFRISPYAPPKIRAVKKEQKLYLWDWSLLSDHGPACIKNSRLSGSIPDNIINKKILSLIFVIKSVTV